jgi:hypothetical protein
MARTTHRFAVTVLAGSVVVCAGQGAAAGTPTGDPAGAVTARAAEPPGRLEGRVTDERGLPLGGVAVTVQGSAFAYTLTDRDGRFVLADLEPGPYVLRANLPGFIASTRTLVQVLPAGATWRGVRLQKMDAPGRVLAAGLGPADAAGTEAPAGASTAAEGEAAEPPDHDHGPVAWRIRHGKRSVLRDAQPGDVEAGVADDLAGDLARQEDGAARLAAELWSGLPLSGRVQFLTTSSFDSAEQLLGGAMPQGVAFVTVSAPAGPSAGWSAQAAYSDGDFASWVFGGSYAGRISASHTLDAGVSFATQRYEGPNALTLVAVTDANRQAGAIFAFDEWRVSSRTAITYGANVARYGYLDGEATLVSPRLAVRWRVGDRTWVRGEVGRDSLAPGAEEFVPSPLAAVWLPPQRTFSTLVPGAPLRAETSDEFEVSLEREWASLLLTARGFRQAVDNQVVTLFDLPLPAQPVTGGGHYFTANGGSVTASGWGVGVSRAVASRLRGSVVYTFSQGRWTGAPVIDETAIALWAPSVLRRGDERLHDLTTVIETDIPETATRVYAAYRLNTGFASPSTEEDAAVFGARFDIQVAQRLPFLGFTNTEWEVLFAVRNLLRELESGAFYDELMVVRPPKRIVGGLMVRF